MSPKSQTSLTFCEQCVHPQSRVGELQSETAALFSGVTTVPAELLCLWGPQLIQVLASAADA